MAKTNKKCCLCGKDYYYCSHCPSKSPSYMLHSCSENCRDITEVVSAYMAKDLDEKKAAEKLRKCDLTGLETFKKGAKATIKKILEAAPAEPVQPAKVSQPTVNVTAKPVQTTAPTPKPVINKQEEVKK